MAAQQQIATAAHDGAQTDEAQAWEARDQREDEEDATGDEQRLGLRADLAGDVAAEIDRFVDGDAGHEDAGGDRDEQPRNLLHQPVADG